MNRGETISARDIGLASRAETALWSVSFAIVTALTTTALYGAALVAPPSDDSGGGAPLIMIELAPVPVSPNPIGEQIEAAGSDTIPASDDEAVAGNDRPAPLIDAEPEPEASVLLEEPLALEDDETDGADQTAEAEVIEQPTASDDQEVVAPVENPADPSEVETPAVEAELTLPQRAEIPHDIAQLRSQTPATSHVPPQQQAAAARSAAPAQAAASATAPQPAAPPAPQAPPAPDISPQRWQGQLFAHLERFKRYPSAASQRREQGTVYVQFSIDAGGNILSSRIVGSSGYVNLDDAVSQMMRSASPVPRPPAEVGSPATLTVPIDFALR